MIVLHLTTTDPAGAIYNLAQATNRHTEIRARVFASHKIEHMGFGDDIGPITDRADELEALLIDADVFHLHKIGISHTIEIASEQGTGRQFKISDFLKIGGKKKKCVFHIHGHPYERGSWEENGARLTNEDGAVLAVTPDLVDLYRPVCGKVQYFPNCVPQNDLHYLPRQTDTPLMVTTKHKNPTPRIIIAQTPTNTLLKDTHILRRVGEKIGKDRTDFLVLTVQAVSHRLALAHKRSAHVIFDHMQGYYGLCSLEGMAMGKPVIAGLSDSTIRQIEEFWDIGGMENALPWVVCRTEEELEAKIIELLDSRALRLQVGTRSRRFMETIWSEKNVAHRLAAIYQAL